MTKRKRILLICMALLTAIAAAVWLKISSLERSAIAHAEVGRGVIKCFGEYATGLKKGDIDHVLSCYAPGFSSEGPMRFEEELVSSDGGGDLYRWQPSEESAVGVEAARSRLSHLLDKVKKLKGAKLKIDAMLERHGNHGAAIRAILILKGVRKSGELFQSYARLNLDLERQDGTWLITRESFIDGDTVLGKGAGFTNIAESAGIDFAAKFNPMYQTPEWEPKRFGIFKYASAGVSAADYDNDGHEDLFFADGAGYVLYRNLGTGQFEDVTIKAGLQADQPGYNTALFADLDNDGHQDLFLGGITRPSKLYRGNGDTFLEVPITGWENAPLVTTSAAVDYDNDGDLDIYMGRYLDPRVDLPTTLFYTRNGAGNTLLRNDGNMAFTDVTEQAGVREGGLTLGVSWSDYDRDGDPDLYVANDFGRNALLRNEGDGTFTDVSLESQTLDFGFGMSSSFGDVDNDGDPDIYVSNVRSSQRWFGQSTTLYKYLINSLKQGTMGEDWPLYEEVLRLAGKDWHNYGDGMVKGNSLLLNQGNGVFEDVAEIANANPYGWYWASNMFDYDNDGRLDVYAANGWISGHKTDDL